MPSSVSFWTTHSGRSPLTGAKATVRAGSARGLELHRAVAAEQVPSSSSRASPAAPGGAGPTAAPVGDDDLLARAQAQHPAEMVRVLVAQHRVRGIVDEDLRGCRGPHGDGGEGGRR